MKNRPSKTIHETFTRFFEEPSRESLRVLLKEHFGELRQCDFKDQWLENHALSKHILGMANFGGGCIIFGVKENEDKSLSPSGLEKLKDKADITNGIKYFLPDILLSQIDTCDFYFEASEYSTLVGKKFQTLFVEPDLNQIPFVSKKSGTNIREGAIYTRREGLTEEASFEEVHKIIETRISMSLPSTQARHLLEHLEELKILFAEIPQNLAVPGQLSQMLASNLLSAFQGISNGSKPNPEYPTEHYTTFVRRLIDSKKRIIEKSIGLL